MLNIKVNSSCKSFKKEDKMMRRAIAKSLGQLSAKLDTAGKSVNEIFNNDSIVYDRINEWLFIYKAHAFNNIQLRLVCHCDKTEKGVTIYLVDYEKKKQNNKNYISEFNKKFRNAKREQMDFYDYAV